MLTDRSKPQFSIMYPDLDYFIKPEAQAVETENLPQRLAGIKLDQNENPFGFPELLKEKFWKKIKAHNWARYPDARHHELKEALANYHRLAPEQLLVANGTHALLQALLMVTVTRGVAVVIPQPTFPFYKLTVRILSGYPIEVALQRGDFSLPVDGILESANRLHARLIILCSPNDPTGVAYPPAQVEEIFAGFPGLVVIDEAYAEFSEQNFQPLLRKYENLVLLRTLSNAWGMAACRVGYLLAHPAVVREVAKASLPYNVNLFSEVAALVALEHAGELRQGIRELIRERDRLMAELRKLYGMKIHPSAANFFLAEFDAPVGEIFEHLLAQGVLVRNLSHYPMLENCLRLSVGTSDENGRLIAALRASL